MISTLLAIMKYEFREVLLFYILRFYDACILCCRFGWKYVESYFFVLFNKVQKSPNEFIIIVQQSEKQTPNIYRYHESF